MWIDWLNEHETVDKTAIKEALEVITRTLYYYVQWTVVIVNYIQYYIRKYDIEYLIDLNEIGGDHSS